MLNKNRVRKALVPLMFAGLAAPGLLSGCGDAFGECDPNLAVKFKALNAAVNGLVTVSGEIKAGLAVACASIATDLGATDVPDVGDGSGVSDDDLKAACASASASLDAEVQAGVTIALSIEGGSCEVNAEAQFSCEASCDVSGGCEPGSIDIRCEPGQLSGECTAECSGSCTVETGSVTCEGKCGGTCEGECSGMCEGGSGMNQCNGNCSGSCTGECSGTCEVVAPSASCSGSCKGECSVSFTAPSCEGTIEPPSCDLDVDCQAGCDGQAKFEAKCTPPKVTVNISGGASANLKTTLEANFPAIIELGETKAKLVVNAAGDVASAFGSAAAAIVTAPACALEFGADFGASIAGSVEASASVSVSVSASASVSGSAGG
jgi:hypothetical protein